MSIKYSTGTWASWLCTGSMKAIYANGVIAVRSGPQPDTPDLIETGDLVALITESGLTFVPGAPENGLNFQDTTTATLLKLASETWQGDFLADGIMGWFRFYANDMVTGASTTAVRFDGVVGTSTRADLEVVTTQATIGGSVAPNNFKLNFSICA